MNATPDPVVQRASVGNEVNRGTLGTTLDATHNGTVTRRGATFAGDAVLSGFGGSND